MTNPLDRIEKLIALALDNPTGEEARSAAVMALRLMREHGIQLVAPRPDPTSSRSRVPTSDEIYADLLNLMRRSARWEPMSSAQWSAPYQPPTYTPPIWPEYPPPKWPRE